MAGVDLPGFTADALLRALLKPIPVTGVPRPAVPPSTPGLGLSIQRWQRPSRPSLSEPQCAGLRASPARQPSVLRVQANGQKRGVPDWRTQGSSSLPISRCPPSAAQPAATRKAAAASSSPGPSRGRARAVGAQRVGAGVQQPGPVAAAAGGGRSRTPRSGRPRLGSGPRRAGHGAGEADHPSGLDADQHPVAGLRRSGDRRVPGLVISSADTDPSSPWASRRGLRRPGLGAGQAIPAASLAQASGARESAGLRSRRRW